MTTYKCNKCGHEITDHDFKHASPHFQCGGEIHPDSLPKSDSNGFTYQYSKCNATLKHYTRIDQTNWDDAVRVKFIMQDIADLRDQLMNQPARSNCPIIRIAKTKDSETFDFSGQAVTITRDDTAIDIYTKFKSVEGAALKASAKRFSEAMTKCFKRVSENNSLRTMEVKIELVDILNENARYSHTEQNALRLPPSFKHRSKK
jgi:hypothetical protein